MDDYHIGPLVGFGQIWSDSVGFSRTWSDLVGF